MVPARVILTAANSRYFGSLTNLVGSIFVHCPEIDEILIYDLGLSSLERLMLAKVRKVQIKEVPPFCTHYLDIESFAWKTAAICDALEHGEAVLWLDAGIEIQRSLSDLFQTIEQDGYLFTVTPLDDPNCRIGHLSHDRSLELLGADTEYIRNSLMVNAGVMGYLRGHPASELAHEAMQYAANPEIIIGPRYSHRHDQTIYSVLRVKSHLPAQYNIFHLANVHAQYPFLIKDTGQGIVRDAVASAWSWNELFVYLLITRDSRPYGSAGWIEFVRHSLFARLLLHVWTVASKQRARASSAFGSLGNGLRRLPFARSLGPRTSTQVRTSFPHED